MIAVAPINSDAPIVPRQGDIDSLMAHAPTDCGQLPAYFGALDFEQLDTCWVAVISAAFFEAEDRGSLSLLARSLVTVRERYRGRAPVEPAGGTTAQKGPLPIRTKTHDFPDRLEKMYERLRVLLPRVGDSLPGDEILSRKPNRATILRAIARHSEGEFAIAWFEKGRKDGWRGTYQLVGLKRMKPAREAR